MLLVCENVSYQKGKTIILKDINLKCGVGLTGIVGENGVGKTTLLRILTNIYKLTPEKIFFIEKGVSRKISEVKKHIGYLPQHFQMYPQLTGEEYLRFVAKLKKCSSINIEQQITDVLEKVNLLPHKDKRIKHYSGGMLRRIGIAQALIGNPKILILDEPTVGLDPEERKNFNFLIKELSREKIVLLATHIISDLEAKCDNLIYMKKQSIAFTGTVQDFKKSSYGYIWSDIILPEKLKKYTQKYYVLDSIHKEDVIEVHLVSKDKPTSTATLITPTIEESYLFYNHKYKVSEETK
ncbi:MAG: ATP-binding cassette domain-containing protein [Clostridia bacterium]|nr:ATP-binding cassette domain-containing protein [Clostridia bacterium]